MGTVVDGGSDEESRLMSFDLSPFVSIPLTPSLLEHLLQEHESVRRPHLDRLWRYYRNTLSPPTAEGGSSGPPAQASGLPSRLSEQDVWNAAYDDARDARPVVIENDIAWRVNTLVDFMFPEPPRIISLASDATTRAAVEALVDAVFGASGGISMWQTAALLASIHGTVDFLLETDGLAAWQGRAVDVAGGCGVAGVGPSCRGGGRHTCGARVECS